VWAAAVQNQDFTLIDDYVTGLKTLLYLKSLDGAGGLDPARARQTPVHQRGKSLLATGQSLPAFGPYKQRRKRLSTSCFELATLLKPDPASTRFGQRQRPVTLLRQCRPGWKYYDLDNKQGRVVALVNDDLCINCGKCYMTCNDSGYQTTAPAAPCAPLVCPIIDCITMVPRVGEYVPKRGVPFGARAGAEAGG
uniref:4Fe-4S ferredoxin-type domain-containing protein n=1 Tax=Macrostomum lignano TaxID=282301 RepID=A0A1I8FC39_9PLAT